MAEKHITHEELTELLGRAIADAHFRGRLLADPKGVLTDEGYAPSDAAVHFFDSLKHKGFETAAESVRVTGRHDPIKLAGDM